MFAFADWLVDYRKVDVDDLATVLLGSARLDIVDGEDWYEVPEGPPEVISHGVWGAWISEQDKMVRQAARDKAEEDRETKRAAYTSSLIEYNRKAAEVEMDKKIVKGLQKEVEEDRKTRGVVIIASFSLMSTG